MKKDESKRGSHNASIEGNISGCNNHIGGHQQTTYNYSGLSKEALISMIEERFQHMLEKEEQVKTIFEENRKLTDEVIRQNADFRLYNEAYRKLQERYNVLADKLAERNKL